MAREWHGHGTVPRSERTWPGVLGRGGWRSRPARLAARGVPTLERRPERGGGEIRSQPQSLPYVSLVLVRRLVPGVVRTGPVTVVRMCRHGLAPQLGALSKFPDVGGDLGPGACRPGGSFEAVCLMVQRGRHLRRPGTIGGHAAPVRIGLEDARGGQLQAGLLSSWPPGLVRCLWSDRPCRP